MGYEVYGRSIWVYRPWASNMWPYNPLPVVVVLHGSSENPASIARVTRFSQVADEAQFLLVFPDMKVPKGPDWKYGWPGEVAFFQAMIAMVSFEYNFNHRQVYICGHSSGGSMALLMQNKL